MEPQVPVKGAAGVPALDAMEPSVPVKGTPEVLALVTEP